MIRSLPRSLTAVVAITASVAFLAAAADSAIAKSTVFAFSSTPSTTRAGAHPTVVTTVEPGNRFSQSPMPACECDDPKDIVIHTPAGVIANPHVISECSLAELSVFACPPESQVGLIVLHLGADWIAQPLYRTVPRAEEAALFVFLAPVGFPIPQYIAVNARTGGDYGLDFDTTGIEHALPPSYIGNIFWGVPGDASHDLLRFGRGEQIIACSSNPTAAVSEDRIPGDCGSKPPHSSSLPLAPFTQNPTTCVGPLSSSIETIAYDVEADHAEAPWPATTGCDKLSFNPSLAAPSRPPPRPTLPRAWRSTSRCLSSRPRHALALGDPRDYR